MPVAQRRKSREAALRVLYQLELSLGDPEAAFISIADEMKLKGDVSAYAKTLIDGVRACSVRLDALIGNHSEKWSLERMAVIDRNVLRIAVFEMTAKDAVPYKVVIDEAVELAKRYGSDESGAFVNGILDAIAKDAGLTEEASK